MIERTGRAERQEMLTASRESTTHAGGCIPCAGRRDAWKVWVVVGVDGSFQYRICNECLRELKEKTRYC